MIEARYQPSQPLGPASRLALRFIAGLVVAGAATALLAVWLSDVEWSRWWLIVVIGAPTIAATMWARRGRGPATTLFVGAGIAAACTLLAGWIWVPDPASFAFVRAHEAAATSTARQVMATMPNNTCRAPSPSDLGVLAQLGPWAQVCVHGPFNGHAESYDLVRPPDSSQPDLTYPRSAGACTWHITGGWYARVQETSDPGDPCPNGYRFHPGT